MHEYLELSLFWEGKLVLKWLRRNNCKVLNLMNLLRTEFKGRL
jgi:hypothetical protein